MREPWRDVGSRREEVRAATTRAREALIGVEAAARRMIDGDTDAALGRLLVDYVAGARQSLDGSLRLERMPTEAEGRIAELQMRLKAVSSGTPLKLN